MSMAVKDRITSIVLFILSITSYFIAKNYPKGAGAFPKVIFIVAIILSCALFISSFLLDYKIEKKNIKFFRIFCIVIFSIIYFILFPLVGFFIATPIYLFVVMFILKYKKVYVLIFYPLCFTLFLYLVFKVFLRVPLPMGILG
jgi:O-antigen/teichoic acid export membrane protein